MWADILFLIEVSGGTKNRGNCSSNDETKFFLKAFGELTIKVMLSCWTL